MTVSPLDRTLRESAAPAATMVARGLLPSPFDARLRPLNLHQDWMPWAGYLSPRRFDSVEAEYFAIRNQATLFDVSPMHTRSEEHTSELQSLMRIQYAVFCLKKK